MVITIYSFDARTVAAGMVCDGVDGKGGQFVIAKR